jgi:hypothetical protein
MVVRALPTGNDTALKIIQAVLAWLCLLPDVPKDRLHVQGSVHELPHNLEEEGGKLLRNVGKKTITQRNNTRDPVRQQAPSA